MENENVYSTEQAGGAGASSVPSPRGDEPLGSESVDRSMYRAARVVTIVLGVLLMIVLPLGMKIGRSEQKNTTMRIQTPQQHGRILEPQQYGQPYIEEEGATRSVPRPNGSRVNQNGLSESTTVLPPTVTHTEKSAQYGDQGVGDSAVPLNRGVDDMNLLVSNISEAIVLEATSCRMSGGTILSGSGGDSLCSTVKQSAWPWISVCGPKKEDTKWTVFRGDTETWDVTVTCAQKPACNGPENALCRAKGCTFSEACFPRKEQNTLPQIQTP